MFSIGIVDDSRSRIFHRYSKRGSLEHPDAFFITDVVGVTFRDQLLFITQRSFAWSF